MNIEYTFFFNDQPLSVVKACANFIRKIDKNIGDQLIQYQKYNLISKVQPQNFQTFLDYLMSNNSHLEINSDNYCDYYLLNKEFNTDITNTLLKPEFDNLRIECSVNVLISQDLIDKSPYEKDVALNIDYCLEYFPEKMSKIQLTSLYNIFNHNDLKLIDHEKAYQFICQNINQNENNQIHKKAFCILLGSLDATKMSEKSINESVSKKDERFGYVPKSNDSFVCSINKKLTEITNQIDHKFEQLFSFIQVKFDSIEKKYNILSKKIDDSINEIQININDLSQTCKNKNDEIQNICDDVKNVSQEEEEIKNDLQHLKNKIDLIQNKFLLNFDFDNDSFKGIIHYLTDEFGGNVHQKKIVNVTSSSISSSRFAYYAVDLDDTQFYFCSDNIKDQFAWLKYDFKNRRVRSTHYSIRSSNCYNKGQYNLISWVIEGSNTNDDDDWTQLDIRPNVPDLDGINKVKTYEMQTPSNEFFRYLRIRATGKDSYGCNYMLFSALEYFGSLIYL